MAKAKSQLTPIGSILGRTLKGKQWGGGLAFGKLCVKWPLIVGDTIARHAEPSKIFGKTLLIRVDHHAWIQELTFMKKDLLDKIIQSQPALGIKDVRFEVGSRLSPEST